MATEKKEALAERRSFWPHLWDELTDFDRLWNRPFFGLPFRGREGFIPKTDIFEKNGKLVVNAELPGVKKEDVHVALENDFLVISGERKHEEKVEEEDIRRWECSYGSFYRRLPLGFEIDPAKINAQFKDGVLKLEVPMPKEKKARAKEIALN